MRKIILSYLCVEETGVNSAPRHPKDILKSDKTHSNKGICIFSKSTRTTIHNFPVFFCSFLFFFYITKLGEKRGSRKIARDKGERVEVGGGLEMNGSGGFIGCCQGG